MCSRDYRIGCASRQHGVMIVTPTGLVEPHDAIQPRPAPRRFRWAWLGVLPFFLFATAFLLLPAASLVIGSFQDSQGSFTLANIVDLSQPFILDAYGLSIKVSLVTALGGGLFGFL